MELKTNTIRNRVHRLGRNYLEARTTPTQNRVPREQKHPTLSKQSVYNRIHRGRDTLQALTTPTNGWGGPRFKTLS